jgi:hypothetical protein
MKRLKAIVLLTMLLMFSDITIAYAATNFPPVDTTVTITSTNLPIVWIEVGGDSIMRDQRITAYMKIIYNGKGVLNYADTVAFPGQRVDYEGYIALRHRGNSSYACPKKPYLFHTMEGPLEQTDKKKKVSLLGMGKDNKWALLAPYQDKSMIRDLLAYEISGPWMEYTPQGRFCEVYLDGIYYGVFILTEVVSQGKNRLNLPDPGDSDDALTGGYIMEVDCDDEPYHLSKYAPTNSNGYSFSGRSIYFQYKWPDYEDMTQEQIDYIDNAIDEMEDAFASPRYKDPEVGYAKYIDVQNFVDYQLAEELAHNVDAYRLSGKFFKRRDSVDNRFKMVIWDMNLAYGNAKHLFAWKNDNWRYRDNANMYYQGEMNLIPFWWIRLNNDNAYKERLKERWAQYRESNVSDRNIMATIDSLTRVVTSYGAMDRNSRAWPTWGEYVWPNYYVSTDYEDEIAYLKQWLTERIAWMDSKLGYVAPEPPDPPEPQFVVGDCNGDGQVTIGDVNFLIDVLLTGETLDEQTFTRCDVNSDGEISIADVTSLIEILLYL